MTNNSNETQIRKIIEDWALAVRNEDLDNILAHHSDDILMYDVPAPLLQSKGLDKYKKTWETYFTFSQKSGVFDIQELHITASDTVAFCSAIMKCKGKEADGKDITLIFRLTVGLKKIHNQWVITHEHHSLPSA